MHPTAMRPLIWGIVLLVVGALLVAFGLEIHTWLAGTVGSPATDVVLRLVSTASYALTPLGAALVGAAVVITALAPRVRQPADATWPSAE